MQFMSDLLIKPKNEHLLNDFIEFYFFCEFHSQNWLVLDYWWISEWQNHLCVRLLKAATRSRLVCLRFNSCRFDSQSFFENVTILWGKNCCVSLSKIIYGSF